MFDNFRFETVLKVVTMVVVMVDRCQQEWPERQHCVCVGIDIRGATGISYDIVIGSDIATFALAFFFKMLMPVQLVSALASAVALLLVCA